MQERRPLRRQQFLPWPHAETDALIPLVGDGSLELRTFLTPLLPSG